jgi:hypothetical protein
MPVLPRRGAAVLDPPAGTWPGPEARRGQALDGPNLLPDGGFEQGLAAWGKVDARVYALAEGGFESARFLRVTAAGRASDLGRVLGDLQPGRTYLLAYHSRASTIADLRIIVRDPATAQYLVTGRPEQGAEWQRTVLRFAAPGPSVKIEISPRAAGSADLDGFGLYLVP